MTSWCLRKENKLMGILAPASFLVEIGKVIIAQQIIADEKQTEFRDALKELQDVDLAESRVVGATTAEVSAKIFENWKFEPGLVNVILHSDDPENADEEFSRAAAILKTVRATIQLNATISDDSIAKAKELIAKYDLDLESYENAIENVK